MECAGERGQGYLLHGNSKPEQKQISTLLSSPESCSCALSIDAMHTPSFLTREGNPHPELSGGGIRVAEPSLSPVWLSEALYVSPVCTIPQTLHAYCASGTALLDISAIFEQSYE